MKKILKMGLLMTIIAVTFTLLGNTNVNAAVGDLVFKKVTVGTDSSTGKTTFTPTDPLTEFDAGNIIFGNPDFMYFAITNTTDNAIGIYDIGGVADKDHFTFSTVDVYFNTTTDTTGGIEIQPNTTRILRLYIDAATESNFGTRTLNTTVTFPTSLSDNLEFNITGTDVKKSVGAIETPTINPNDLLTYNGIEQTMNFYTYNGIDYTLVDFSAADSLFTITGNTATDAGTHTAKITLKHPDFYKWDDSLSANLSGDNNETYSIEWEMEEYITPTPSQHEGITGKTLNTISLPSGWSWNAPNTQIEAGVHNYAATFIHPESNPNYARVNGQIAVNGKQQFEIAFNLTPNSTVDAFQNPDYLIKGDSKTYNLSTESGYIFTSIKVNGVEQLSNDTVVTEFPININNINENYTISAETTQIKFPPMEGYENLTFDRYKDETFRMKWDLDFDNFEARSVRINGKEIYKGYKFLRGSVILELDNTVLSTLPLGENIIEIELASGELAVATFNLIDSSSTNAGTNTNNNNNTPETGDNSNFYGLIAVAIISILGVYVVARRRNRA